MRDVFSHANTQTAPQCHLECFFRDWDRQVEYAAQFVRDAAPLRAAIEAHVPLPNRDGNNSFIEYSVLSAVRAINNQAHKSDSGLEISLRKHAPFNWQKRFGQFEGEAITEAIYDRVAVPLPLRERVEEMLRTIAKKCFCCKASCVECRSHYASAEAKASSTAEYASWYATIDELHMQVANTLKEWMSTATDQSEVLHAQ